MWDELSHGAPGEKPRRVSVSKELLTALNDYCRDTGNSKQMVFSKASIKLLMRYARDVDISSPTPPDISFSNETLDELECIMENNIMPGVMKRKKKHGRYEYNIHVRFQSGVTFEWAQHLERLQKVNDTSDFVRRVLTWFLKEKGYLKNEREERPKFSFLHRADQKSKESPGQQHSAPQDQAQPSS